MTLDLSHYTKTEKTIGVADVIFDQEQYPRDEGFDQATVDQYGTALNLPRIVINENMKLVDGYHRLIARRVGQQETIDAEVWNVPDDDIMWVSVILNARHGLQLSMRSKKSKARQFYSNGHKRSIDDIATVLAASKGAVSNWTSDLRQKERDAEKERVWDLWLGCKTQQEIADICGISQQLVAKNIKITTEFINEKRGNPPDSLQLYTVWKFQTNDDRYGIKYPGRIPGQIIENVLYYYTDLFAKVVDPFGGGGTTVDVCKEMNRRYLAYDINPVRDDIIENDITSGFPKAAKGADLVFLDPPYWAQKQGDYSAHETNLANLPLDGFYDAMAEIFKGAKHILSPGGVIALIIGPTQNDGVVYDHAYDLSKRMEKHFSFANRIIVPYTTQQVKGYHVADAKKGKYLLKLHRDLLIYRRN